MRSKSLLGRDSLQRRERLMMEEVRKKIIRPWQFDWDITEPIKELTEKYGRDQLIQTIQMAGYWPFLEEYFE